jgi:probable rRNA maturation factor
MSVSLSITNQSGRGGRTVDGAWLQRQLRRVLKLLKIAEGEWTITIVDDRAMAALHKKTMNLPTTTDVLTFDFSGGRGLELDSVLCAEEAVRRAKELKHSVKNELLLYAIHSLLHAQGYDDLKAQDAAEMHRREDEILLRLGVGAVYHKPAKGDPGAAGRSAPPTTRRTTRKVSGSRKKAS